MGAGVGKVKRKMNRAINVVWVGDLQDGDIILIRHLSVPLLDRWSIHPETARGVIASSQGEFSLTRRSIGSWNDVGVVVLLNNIPHIARASVTGIQMLPIESLLNAAHESHGRIQIACRRLSIPQGERFRLDSIFSTTFSLPWSCFVGETEASKVEHNWQRGTIVECFSRAFELEREPILCAIIDIFEENESFWLLVKPRESHTRVFSQDGLNDTQSEFEQIELQAKWVLDRDVFKIIDRPEFECKPIELEQLLLSPPWPFGVVEIAELLQKIIEKPQNSLNNLEVRIGHIIRKLEVLKDRESNTQRSAFGTFSNQKDKHSQYEKKHEGETLHSKTSSVGVLATKQDQIQQWQQNTCITSNKTNRASEKKFPNFQAMDSLACSVSFISNIQLSVFGSQRVNPKLEDSLDDISDVDNTSSRIRQNIIELFKQFQSLSRECLLLRRVFDEKVGVVEYINQYYGITQDTEHVQRMRLLGLTGSKQKFVQLLLNRVRDALRQIPHKMLAEFKRSFLQADKDNSGSINAHELKHVLEDIKGHPVSVSEVDDVLRALPQNERSSIPFNSFCSVVWQAQLKKKVPIEHDLQSIVSAEFTFLILFIVGALKSDALCSSPNPIVFGEYIHNAPSWFQMVNPNHNLARDNESETLATESPICLFHPMPDTFSSLETSILSTYLNPDITLFAESRISISSILPRKKMK